MQRRARWPRTTPPILFGSYRLMTSSLFLLVVLPTITQAHAHEQAGATIQVAPVLVAIKPGHSITGVRVINPRAKEATFRARVEGWRQKDGADIFTPTTDVIVSPDCVTLPEKGACLVRLVANAPDCDQESAYRISLFAVGQPSEQTVASIPVFITPLGARAALRLDIQPRVWGYGLSLTNIGDACARIERVEDIDYGPIPAPRYLLAGGSVELSLPPNAGVIRVTTQDLAGGQVHQIIHPADILYGP